MGYISSDQNWKSDANFQDYVNAMTDQPTYIPGSLAFLAGAIDFTTATNTQYARTPATPADRDLKRKRNETKDQTNTDSINQPITVPQAVSPTVPQVPGSHEAVLRKGVFATIYAIIEEYYARLHEHFKKTLWKFDKEPGGEALTLSDFQLLRSEQSVLKLRLKIDKHFNIVAIDSVAQNVVNVLASKWGLPEGTTAKKLRKKLRVFNNAIGTALADKNIGYWEPIVHRFFENDSQSKALFASSQTFRDQYTERGMRIHRFMNYLKNQKVTGRAIKAVTSRRKKLHTTRLYHLSDPVTESSSDDESSTNGSYNVYIYIYIVLYIYACTY